MNKHYEKGAVVNASPEAVFGFVDDHERFSSHMSKSSWMMGGGRMEVVLDEGRGQRVGSHIVMKGKVFGTPLFLDEVVTAHEPPAFKEWETVGDPQLLVVGNYRVRIEITPENGTSLVRITIDYDLPRKRAWLGKLFGAMYAKWCIGMMLAGVTTEFSTLRI